MAPARPRTGRRAEANKAGFTLLEMLFVLAIMGMAAAMVLPRIGAQMDQAVANTEAFKFQQQVLDLRRQTFHEEQGLTVVSSGELAADSDADPPQAEIQLGQGWSYKLSAPLTIDAGGVCSTADVEIYDRNRLAARLQGAGASCLFPRMVG